MWLIYPQQHAAAWISYHAAVGMVIIDETKLQIIS